MCAPCAGIVSLCNPLDRLSEIPDLDEDAQDESFEYLGELSLSIAKLSKAKTSLRTLVPHRDPAGEVHIQGLLALFMLSDGLVSNSSWSLLITPKRPDLVAAKKRMKNKKPDLSSPKGREDENP